MRPRAAVAISGTTGADQRLRHGLGEHKPYRWRGKPNWNPGEALPAQYSKRRKTRPCPKCGAQPGEQCHTADGTPMARNSHRGR
jgi:hypothetical protein